VPKKPRPSPPGLEISRAATGELVLRINGRHVQGNQRMLAVLARLFDNLGTVIPYTDLCLLIGHKSANSASTHVLRQYTVWLVLIANKAPYVITVARDFGYGLCKMGGEPRLSATSRSARCRAGTKSTARAHRGRVNSNRACEAIWHGPLLRQRPGSRPT
jgi:hypothetical protein